MADACIFLMENIDVKDIAKELKIKGIYVQNTHINIGNGNEISIKDLAFLIKDIVEFSGNLYFNHDKMDGTQRKVTDNSRIVNYGWNPKVGLREGLQRMREEMHCKIPVEIRN